MERRYYEIVLRTWDYNNGTTPAILSLSSLILNANITRKKNSKHSTENAWPSNNAKIKELSLPSRKNSAPKLVF